MSSGWPFVDNIDIGEGVLIQPGGNLVLPGGLTTGYPIHNGGSYFPKTVSITCVANTEYISDYTDGIIYLTGDSSGCTFYVNCTDGMTITYVNQSSQSIVIRSYQGGTVDRLAQLGISVNEYHSFVVQGDNLITTNANFGWTQDDALSNVTLLNGWTGGLQYGRTMDGSVFLSGLLAATGATSNTVANLPAGYYPTAGYGVSQLINTNSTAVGVMTVGTNGAITCNTIGTTTPVNALFTMSYSLL